MDLSADFWNSKYKTKQTGWDLGEISPPIKAYVDQLTNKNLKILIPGGGNSYEAEYLFHQGFTNVYVVDFSEIPLTNIKARIPNFPSDQLIQADFFSLEMKFDLILEQTFFSAIHPSLRKAYVQQMAALLKPHGKLVGLLFDDPLNTDKPPFGGSKEEYIALFNSHFNILQLEEAYNSHENRGWRELFFRMEVK